MSIDRLQSALGAVAHAVHQGAGDLDAVRLRRSPGSGRPGRWIVAERSLGVVCGEVGAGKTVAARAATASLDSSRYSIIYLPNPAVGARGIYTQIVTALGGTPRFYRATLIPQATDLLAAESAERGKTVVLILR